MTRRRHRAPGSRAGIGSTIELDGRPWRLVPAEAVLRRRPRGRPRRSTGRRRGRSGASCAGWRRVARRCGRSAARDHTRCVARAAARRREAPRRESAARRSRRRSAPASSTTSASRGDRAALLAVRGAGDLLISDDLERHGVPEADVRARALEVLEPESTERRAIVEARGRARERPVTWRPRASRRRALESLVADLCLDALG